MKDLVLGFIGAGNMNTAILSGVLRKQMFPPERIWLSNRHAEKLSAFSKLGIRTTTDNRAVARNADILILGVKPQMFEGSCIGKVCNLYCRRYFSLLFEG